MRSIVGHYQKLMRNVEVAELLYNISELLELKGENIFKIRAYAKAARAVEGMSEDIEKTAGEKKLNEIPGIGEAIAEKIEEYVTAGKLGYYEDLKKEISQELHELFPISQARSVIVFAPIFVP